MIFAIRRWASLVLLTAALVPGVAMAQNSNNGLYASMSGAYAIPTDSTVSEKFLGHSLSSKLDAKGGFALMAAFGYDVSENLSVEAELGYRNFRFSKFKGLDISRPRVSGSIDGKFPVKGSISTLSLMGNGVFSARIWEVKPYFGAGLGTARHSGRFDRQTIEIGDESVE